MGGRAAKGNSVDLDGRCCEGSERGKVAPLLLIGYQLLKAAQPVNIMLHANACE